MSKNFSHTIKCDAVQVMQLRNRPAAEIHKAGCAHGAKAEWADAPESATAFVRTVETEYTDDYYTVAPCARKA